MYNNPYYYNQSQPIQPMQPAYPSYYPNYPQYRVYPTVDTKIFASSVKSIRLLMGQGSILLDKLSEASFESKIMTAAQHGKQKEVDNLIKSIGLKVPVQAEYTPTSVRFTLQSPANQHNSVSSLTITMKWGF